MGGYSAEAQQRIADLEAAIDRILQAEHGAQDRQTEACGLCKVLEAALAQARVVRWTVSWTDALTGEYVLCSRCELVWTRKPQGGMCLFCAGKEARKAK